jgi:hypothetical protein
MKKTMKEILNEFELEKNDDFDVVINGIVISDKIRQDQRYEYCVRDREDLIEELCTWVGELKCVPERENDKHLMLMDLKYLLNLKDDYVFSSISTNKYIAQSDNVEEFNKICQEILDLNKKIVKED